jgi:hypothetical protein
MTVRPVGDELLHATDRHTDGERERDRHDKVNSRFSQFYARTKILLKWIGMV